MSGNRDDEEQPPTLREQGIVELPIHNTATAGPLPVDPPDAGVSDRTRARRLLANRLAAELLDPPEATRVTGHDLFSAHVVAMGWDEVPMVALALEYATSAPIRLPSSTILGEGQGGSVARMHTPLFSIVFRFLPEIEPVLVLVDAMPDYAVRVDLDESQAARNRIALMVWGVLSNMRVRRSDNVRVDLSDM